MYATDTGIVTISPKVTTVIAQTRAGMVWAKEYKAYPLPTRTYPVAMTRRAGKRRMIAIYGSSHNTTNIPFNEMIAP